jgi:S-adenosylmethionine/arginine decarboxylase-like enzyme
MDVKRKIWGWHLAVDAAGCDISAITNGDTIKEFSKALVEAIDMKAYGDPIAVHFAAHDPSKGGYTLVQLIETSNICAHFVDSTGEMYLDVFSCKEFDPNIVLETISTFFNPDSAITTVFERGVADGEAA